MGYGSIQKALEEARIVFRFQPHVQLDVVFVFVLQVEDGFHVVLQLVGTHAEGGVVVALEHIGRMIRKAEALQALFNGFLHVFPLGSGGMVAAPRVRVQMFGKHL